MLTRRFSVLLVLLQVTGWTFAQGLSMSSELPLIQDLGPIQVTWKAGDSAQYGIYSDEAMTQKVGVHTVRILDAKPDGSQTRYKVQVQRESNEGQQAGLTFMVTGVTFDVSKGSDFLFASGMGQFKLSSFQSRPGQSFKELGTTSLELKDGKKDVKHYQVTYTDDLGNTEIWVGSDVGPYGIVQAKVVRNKTVSYYKLLEVGK